jgi:hypothetical protein
MYQPCKTCPFRENPIEAGSPVWLIDVMEGLKRGWLNHTCHHTDPKADLYGGVKKTRLCFGFLGMMKRYNDSCISPEALLEMGAGKIDWVKIPTKGVFGSPKEMIRFHLDAIGK